MGSDEGHVPVLLAETLELLAVSPGGLWVDGTVGLGGHAAAVLRASAPDGRLLGLDRDGETLARARERLAEFGGRARLEQADYREIPERLGGEEADGILLDLGISSAQLDDAARGFSFQAEGPLDMRMDRSAGTTAAEVVNRTRERELADLLYEYG
jgi:16S rRNA (cytosine1402-N4)-methyltransferase